MPKSFLYSGNYAKDFEKHKKSLNDRIEQCSDQAELRSFLEENVNQAIIGILYGRLGLGKFRGRKTVAINAICDLKFPNDPTQGSPPVDPNSFGGGGPAAAISFAERILASNNLDSIVKNWARALIVFAKWKVKEVGMPPLEGSSDEANFARNTKKSFRNGQFEEWQMRLLRAVGFVFNQPLHDFTSNAIALRELLQGTGLTYLPRDGRYPTSQNYQYRMDASLEKLDEFNNDLDRYETFRKEKKSTYLLLNQERLDILEEYDLLDFRQRAAMKRTSRTTEGINETFRAWCTKVEEYHREHKHFDVPHAYSPMGYLGLREFVYQARTSGFDRTVYPHDFDFPETNNDPGCIYPGSKLLRDLRVFSVYACSLSSVDAEYLDRVEKGDDGESLQDEDGELPVIRRVSCACTCDFPSYPSSPRLTLLACRRRLSACRKMYNAGWLI